MLFRLILQIALNTAAVYGAAELTPGVNIESIKTALIVFLVLAVINTVVKPVLKLITLPINILTLGLFGLVLNFLLLVSVFHLVPGFTAETVNAVLIFSIILAIISWLVSALFD